MSTALPTIPPDSPKRNLTLTQPENLPHIGLRRYLHHHGDRRADRWPLLRY